MFTKVLVANRGEIAVRVIRTLRELGIASVAVYSDADRGALHVEVADEAVRIGPAPAVQSYLDVDAVVAAAVRTRAQAIHPGYGFLSENPALAEACADAGVVFIGPDVSSLVLMGDKRSAKDSVTALGVPVVPGLVVSGADDSALEDACAELGFPVIVKPSAGGGGKGMRVVHDASELSTALASARREASAAFGDDALLIERFLARARHVEVQVLGDGRGDALHVGDRDCSLQRRHQKVIEEAPAPGLPDEVRARMHADAVTIARSVDYRGVGTVEFVVDADEPSTYYFLEMNTRLQVEHPVTEAVTGLDLVALQILVAAGDPLPIAQGDVVISGHAVEARVYAEDGHHGFLPSSGTLLVCHTPDGVRVDSGVRAGDVVGTAYDPLLLKVIAAGADREAAFDALDRALAHSEILGVAHNIGVVCTLVAEPRVRAGAMTTGLIDELALGHGSATVDPHRLVAAALLLAARREAATTASVWGRHTGWRVGDPAPVSTALVDDDGIEHRVSVLGRTSACVVSVDGAPDAPASLVTTPDGRHASVSVDGVTRTFVTAVAVAGTELVIWVGAGGDAWRFRVPVRHRLRRPEDDDESDGELRSPMPGSIVVVAKAAGDLVDEGEVIAVIEAMKMEYPLVSPFQGTLVSVDVTLGAQVVRDQVVAVVRAELARAEGSR